MRSVWNGTIGFGTVAIPVRAYTATEEHGTGLHQVHLTDGGRVRSRKACEIDGAEIPADEVGRGYELPGGDVVVLREEDLAMLPLPTRKSIEVRAFAPLEQIDPIYFSRSYYLEPEPEGTRAYVLFSEAMQQSGRVAIVQVALRQRESLGMLRVRDQVIVLETMLWPDEIRTPDFPFLHEDVDVRLPDLRDAVTSIEKLSTDFAPRRYTDGYRAALVELIRAKAERDQIVVPTAAAQQARVDDLVAALRDGVADAESGRRRTAVGKAKASARKAADAEAAASKAAKTPRPRRARTTSRSR